MSESFRLTLAQLNPVVGDLQGNAAKALDAWRQGRDAGSDFVMLTEAFMIGYQPQDLVMRPPFWAEAMEMIEALATEIKDGPPLGIGGPYHDGKSLYNAYWILENGQVRARILKQMLPNETVFDEVRLYKGAPPQNPVRIGPLNLGIPICEDAWWPDRVARNLAEKGAEILAIPNGSPYYRGKVKTRHDVIRARVEETGLPVIYLNMVGGQDDQVFDGASFGLDAQGELAFQLPQFDEVIRHVDLEKTADGWTIVPGKIYEALPDYEADYRVMVQALRDYMHKTGFKKVLLGLSGGIDSAIVATIAADALGPDNVRCVMLPSEYTSQGSLDDAKALARNLGCHYDFVPIKAARDAVTETLAPFFEGLEPDVTEENIQSRLRGLLLMAMSNKFGEMLLTTGNKSEVAVGYATIYGDMAGGYNPIKDLYKMRVFETCRWRNANHRDWMMGPAGDVIPVSIIEKPPSAELRDDQKDSDSLPPYEVLDAILEGLVDKELSVAELVAKGFDRDVVKKVEHLIYISEYKRFQSAPGARLTMRSFWLDRRYPIVNRWRDKT
ncbi:NAD+ synthase [Maritimibacter dapengensis]|uniref:Glutamine-dependent NAD(+) synthetase n=1 Tax=Maritimibacter dapengensis TaxID=2836868 RepID=A0ABS6T0S1_9RHOB|nr:NAD+ synthase [Maritimibacter dapengensis]MBV7378585.1 NAD+ synthase [Maritimibacter dapengensis]